MLLHLRKMGNKVRWGMGLMSGGWCMVFNFGVLVELVWRKLLVLQPAHGRLVVDSEKCCEH